MGKRAVLAVSFCVLSLLIFTFSSSVFVSPFSFTASLFSSPRVFLYSVVHAQDNSEVARLKNENLKLAEKFVSFQELKNDNTALRSQFQESFLPSTKLLPARVVGFKGNLDNPNALVLNQGIRNGVKKGMAVVISKNLVGKISSVTDYFSEVILPVHKDFSTLAVSVTHTSPGIVSGYDDFVLFNNVVITDTISKNEVVITKGEIDKNGVGIPEGLIIGKITNVNKSETKPFQNAVIESLLNFKKLSTVFVVTR